MAASTDPANQVDYSQLLPNTQQLQSFAPLPYQAFGATPYVNPALSTAAQVDNSQLPGALSQYEQSLQTSLAPTFQQQNQQMTADLSARGLMDSSAGAQAAGNLQGAQAAALSQGISPLISQFAGFYNSNNQLNATNEQQTGSNNQASLNAGNVYNSELYKSIASGNQQDQNAYIKSLWDMQNGTNTALLNGTLSSYDPNNNGTTSLLNSGLNQAGNAYANTYQAGSGTAGQLGNAFGQVASSIFNKPQADSYSGPDFSNSSSGGY